MCPQSSFLGLRTRRTQGLHICIPGGASPLAEGALLLVGVVRLSPWGLHLDLTHWAAELGALADPLKAHHVRVLVGYLGAGSVGVNQGLHKCVPGACCLLWLPRQCSSPRNPPPVPWDKHPCLPAFFPILLGGWAGEEQEGGQHGLSPPQQSPFPWPGSRGWSVHLPVCPGLICGGPACRHGARAGQPGRHKPQGSGGVREKKGPLREPASLNPGCNP